MTKVRLGIVRLVDSAPAVLAEADRLFAANGLDVELAIEPSWANIADKLAWDALDAAIMPAPLALSMMLGLRGPNRDLYVPTGINRGGNSIAVRSDIPLDDSDPAAAARDLATWLRRQPVLPRFAVVSVFSSHNLLLRAWLSGAGIDPDRDLALVVVPPERVADELAAGRIAGFCAGAPWGERSEQRGIGRIVLGSSAIRPDHLEKVLAISPGLWNGNRNATTAITRALDVARTVCAAPAEADRVAWLLASRLDLPEAAARRALPGGAGPEIVRFNGNPTGWDDLAWMLSEFRRWGWKAPTATSHGLAHRFGIAIGR
jgi:ABC-type nitrate/sulfonate/bicarbonate transport system substrate-binding protein